MHPEPDFFLVPLSPPDARGYCSFGSGVWMSLTAARKAKRVIAEIQPDFIRTGGDNYIHIDQVDLFIEGHPSVLPPGLFDLHIADQFGRLAVAPVGARFCFGSRCSFGVTARVNISMLWSGKDRDFLEGACS